jgi:parallel beta-helix repeat protein
VGSLLVGLCAPADAGTWYVATNGVDREACGTTAEPCRSIRQAIVLASAGDTIVVGPGRYGDLNGNGIFGEAGEEPAEVGWGCECLVQVDKPLTLESRDGAETTVLDAGGAAISVVQLAASGVIFGTPQHGFTLTGGARNACFFGGVAVAEGTSGVRVEGNQAIANGCFGFLVRGGSGHVLRGNRAQANVGDGFLSMGDRVTVQDNAAVANGGHGFVVFGHTHTLLGNAALGNLLAGIAVTGGTDHTITGNNLYGNNTPNVTGMSNCGLANFVAGGPLKATHNFWGAASGPGPDPADAVCDFGGHTTVVPFAPREFSRGMGVR